MRYLSAELRKLLSLRTSHIAAGLCLVAAGIVVGQAVLGPFGLSPWQAVGELGWRLPGVVFYCVCTALIALAIATVTFTRRDA